MNIGSANPELSPDVLVALQEKFAGDERNEVANILREFYWKLRPSVDERIHLSILHAANDLECVRKLVELAKKDWRDVLVWSGFGNDLDAHNKWAEQILK